MARPLVLTCREADFTPQTGECAAPFYSYAAGGLPDLSLADAAAIGWAIAYLLAVAFVFRQIRKFLQSS